MQLDWHGFSDAEFALYDSHPDPWDRERNPPLFYSFIFMNAMLFGGVLAAINVQKPKVGNTPSGTVPPDTLLRIVVTEDGFRVAYSEGQSGRQGIGTIIRMATLYGTQVGIDQGSLIGALESTGQLDSAAAALRAFRETPAVAPTEVIEAIHGRVSGTRGGAAAVAQIDRARGLLRYAGVGNIGGTLVGPERRRGLPSHNGIVGSIVGRVRGFEYEWTQGDVLVMHSDGLQSRWTMDGVAGMVHRDPAVVAALLYRDFARGRDDLTVAVCG